MKIEVTIRRPTGETEVLDMTGRINAAGYSAMTDVLFEASKKATRQAGKGELLSYRNVDAQVAGGAEDALYEIERMFDEAERLMGSEGEYNYDRGLQVERKAEAAFAEWKARYPKANTRRLSEIEAEKAASRERYEASYVARQLD